MIQEFSTYTADPALGNSVLPRTSERRANRLAAHRLRGRDSIDTELRVAIEDQEALRLVAVFPGFAQLQRNPKGVRVTGHVVVKDSTPIMTDDEEAGSKIASLMPDLLKVGLGIQGFGVSGSSAECAVA